jgi:hypothetical protein
MSLAELNRMLKKILSLVLNYDRITRVEKESTLGSERECQTGKDYHGGSEVSDGRMVPPSNEIQIPDPWDDPLM